MGKDEFVGLTVSQLKDELKTRGLPVSGKKSELLDRLNQNLNSVKKPSSKKVAVDLSDRNGTPFFQTLMAGGLGSVEIDRWKAAQNGIAFVMVIAILISLNSNSWYVASYSRSLDGFMFDTSVDINEEVELSYGLSQFKYTTLVTGDFELSQETTVEYSQCFDGEQAQCEKMSNAANFMKISLGLSLIIISTLLAIAIARGFGKLDSGFIDEHYYKIDFWALKLSSSLLSVGLIVYAIIGFTFDSKYIFDGDVSHGLGLTWWIMFVLSSIFVTIVFNTKTMQIIEFVKRQIKQIKSSQ